MSVRPVCPASYPHTLCPGELSNTFTFQDHWATGFLERVSGSLQGPSLQRCPQGMGRAMTCSAGTYLSFPGQAEVGKDQRLAAGMILCIGLHGWW